MLHYRLSILPTCSNRIPIVALSSSFEARTTTQLFSHPRSSHFLTRLKYDAYCKARQSPFFYKPVSKIPRPFTLVQHAQTRRISRKGAAPDSKPQLGPGAPYQPPTTGPQNRLPTAWVPYAELMRLDKPAGSYYLFFPCLFSTLLAASYTNAALSTVWTTSSLFLLGAVIMRGAGCTINDLWDRELDPHVTRTRLRPIARKAVTPINAVAFAGFQCLAGLGVLVQFPVSCLYYGIPSLILVTIYPLAKRVTHYPQVVLGLTFSWGAIMGFPALDIDLMADEAAVKAVASLYTSCVAWTVLYDMIYAHMDIKDDAKIGIKSIALRHEKETKLVLSALAAVQLAFLAMAGSAVGATPVFYGTSCGSAAATLGLMIWRVRLTEVQNCWWWFKNGVWFTGGGISAGLLGEYVFRSDVDSSSIACDSGEADCVTI